MKRYSVILASIFFVYSDVVGSTITYWNHNGSRMYMSLVGDEIDIKYDAPRKGIQEAGANSGDILFKGSFSGQNVNGTAYIFAGRCGKYSYRVSGSMDKNNRNLVLYGKAPVVDRSSCSINKEINDTLRFEYIDNYRPDLHNKGGSDNWEKESSLVYGSYICFQQGMMDKRTQRIQEMGTDKDGFLVKFNGASGLLSLNNATPYSSGPWNFSYLETKEDVNTYSVNDKFFKKFHFKIKNGGVELMLQETDKVLISGECKRISK